GNPFDFFFLDEFYGKQHDDERRFGLVFSLFSVLALFITAMGILGLSAYSVVQRRKEIAIRKVLGAKSISVLLLFVKEYVLLWALAVIIALPIVSKLISSWLAEFAVKTEVSIWMYIIPSVLVLFIAIVTVLVQSRKGMRINPAEGIRYE
ncbi:MAG TPA: FtsX-like permease family protein, partial [Tenuifilaceae bacterium]|nr:FtsX-like permease family protein [Tenuifilaceae bacterium]